MGRWAQARHRGRGGPTSSVTTPPAADDWHMTLDTLDVGAEWDGVMPAFDLVRFRFRDNGGNLAWRDGVGSPVPTTPGTDDACPFSGVSGVQVEAQAQWVDSGSGDPQGDWGASQFLTP